MKDIEFTRPDVPGLEVVFMDLTPPNGVAFIEPQITGSVTAFFETIDGDFERPLPPSLSDTFERVDEMWGFEVGTTQANFLKDPMNLRNIQGAITCSSEPLITRVLYEGVELFAFEDGVSLADASFIVDRDLTKPAPGYEVVISSLEGSPLTKEEAKDRQDRAIRSLSTRQMYALCWSLAPTRLTKPTYDDVFLDRMLRLKFDVLRQGIVSLREGGEASIDHLSAPKASPAWVNPRPWVRKRKGGAA